MNLSWKDLVGTLGTIIVTMIGYLNYKGLNVALISNNRWASALMLVIGLITCAISGKVDGGFAGNYMSVMGALGGLTMIMGIIGIATGNKNVVIAMVFLTIGLWIATTTKHLLTK